MGYNTNFEMGLKELEIVEDALRFRLNQLSKTSSSNAKTCQGNQTASQTPSSTPSQQHQPPW